MSLTREESKQLDEEIKLCIKKNGPMSGYAIAKCVQAIKRTVLWKLRRMAERGELNCSQATKGWIYSLPEPAQDSKKSRPERAPKMVSKEPRELTERTIESEHHMMKRYSSGRPRHGKGLAAMAFEGNGTRKE